MTRRSLDLIKGFFDSYQLGTRFQTKLNPSEEETTLFLPSFSPEQISQLIYYCTDIFASEPRIIQLSSPIVIVGDLHGHIFDLFHILETNGCPPETKYVFLGDYIDKGEFSFETITLLCILKALWPQNITLLRGNHEFHEVCSKNGFEKEIMTLFGNNIYISFLQMFSFLPIAAIIDHKFFCVHGGISPSIHSIDGILTIEYPSNSFNSKALVDLLWSDPSYSTLFFEKSPRGLGVNFGPQALYDFLRTNNLRALIRAHEFQPNGCKVQFSGTLLSIFSASNFCGKKNNFGGVIVVQEKKIKFHKYISLPFYPKRSNVIFKSVPASVYQTPIFHSPRLGLNSPNFAGKAIKQTKRFSVPSLPLLSIPVSSPKPRPSNASLFLQAMDARKRDSLKFPFG